MMKVRWQFAMWRAERNEVREEFFSAWKSDWLCNKLRMRLIGGRVFIAWKTEVEDRKRLQHLALEFFKISIKRSRLSAQAVMAYFSPEDFMADHVRETDLMKIRGLILRT